MLIMATKVQLTYEKTCCAFTFLRIFPARRLIKSYLNVDTIAFQSCCKLFFKLFYYHFSVLKSQLLLSC